MRLSALTCKTSAVRLEIGGKRIRAIDRFATPRLYVDEAFMKPGKKCTGMTHWGFSQRTDRGRAVLKDHLSAHYLSSPNLRRTRRRKRDITSQR
ncbi:MAG: hypothetical protein AAF280_12400, partial [Pseudomonadota bacterium]